MVAWATILFYSRVWDGREDGASGYEYQGGARTHIQNVQYHVGWLNQEYVTSKIGYFFTDPDKRYQNANYVSSYLRKNYYRCYDGTCLDIVRNADKWEFQTASTVNNSLVLHSRKYPRSTSKGSSGTDSLVSEFSFKSTAKSNCNNYYGHRMLTGVPSYTNGPYGDKITFKGVNTFCDEHNNLKLSNVKLDAFQIIPHEAPAQTGVGFYDAFGDWEENDNEGLFFGALSFQQDRIT